MAAALQGRHQGLARLPAVGARHRGPHRRERHRGHAARSRARRRARRAREEGRPETIYARKVVLAGGRDGSGAPYWPAFPSLPDGRKAGKGRVFHSSDAIDFARFKGGKVGVLGASASAFDNAAVALESGAAEAHLFVRRPHLPQINKSKWTVFPGFFHGYPRSRRSDAMADLHLHLFRSRAAAARVGAALRPACGLCDAFRRAVARCGRRPPMRVKVITARGAYQFDAVILATGFSVDLAQRPELAQFPRQDRAVGRSRFSRRRRPCIRRRRGTPISGRASS